MTKYVHISLFKRHESDGSIRLGGVEQFGEYLRRAIPGLQCVSWMDFPAREHYGQEPDYSKARIMNDWLSDRKIVDQDTVAIVDGYWGLGLEDKVGRLISVVHGSYFGRMVRSQVHFWGEYVDFNHVAGQFEMWEHPQAEVVAVADESAKELYRAGIEKEIQIIRHGVDLEIYKPLPELLPDRWQWMHGATSNRKGLHVIEQIQMMEEGLEVHAMDERSGDPAKKAARINQAHCWIMPSAHEGNAYMLLEALACGVPVIAYATGLALEMANDPRCGIITDDLSAQNFYRLIKNFEPMDHSPREWMEQHGSFERFARDWREYLGISN